MMVYSSGDIVIQEKDLQTCLNKMPAGKYSTFDILQKYQGMATPNKGISAARSWNANFGKILKQFSKNTGKIIEVEKNKKIVINGSSTTTSYWQIV